MEVSLGQLSRMLDTDHYVLVVHDQTQCKFSLFKESRGNTGMALNLDHAGKIVKNEILASTSILSFLGREMIKLHGLGTDLG